MIIKIIKNKMIENNYRALNSFIKIFIFICSISLMPHTAKASDYATLLKCGKSYFNITQNFVGSNYNVRSKKFTEYSTIRTYSEDYIVAGRFWFNRNTGKLDNTICNVISRDELPILKAEGKKF